MPIELPTKATHEALDPVKGPEILEEVDDEREEDWGGVDACCAGGGGG